MKNGKTRYLRNTSRKGAAKVRVGHETKIGVLRYSIMIMYRSIQVENPYSADGWRVRTILPHPTR